MGLRNWICLTAVFCGSVVSNKSAALPGVSHVVVIGVDGLSPSGIAKAKAPQLKKLMERGASTMHARAVMPTSSSPNWASMIMGAGPEQHGVTSNDWETNKFEFTPTVKGSGGIFPTIFGLLREQHPSATSCVFHDWDGFGRLFERGAVNFIEDSVGPTNAVRHAVTYWQEKKPTFTFIHLDHVDHAGHEIGWGTPEYLAAVAVADDLIGEAIEGLRIAGMWEKTILLVTSDHGGLGKKHGGLTMDELEIPWILAGPGVAPGRELTNPVNTFDTAPTLARIFGLQTPSAWIGRPVLEAFASQAKPSR